MSKVRLKFFLLIILLILFCQKKESTIITLNPKYETPQKLIETYWRALFEERYKDALMCFVNFREADFNTKELFPIPDMDSLWIDSIISLKIDNDQAEIYYMVAFIYGGEKQERAIITGDKLKLTKEGWKISDPIVPR